MELLGIINVEFSLTNQLLIRFFHSSDIGGKMIAMTLNISYIWPSGKPMIQLRGSTVQYSHCAWGIHETS
jgi:hypothetical protein